MILPTAPRFLFFGGSSFPGITPCGFIPGYITVTPMAFLCVCFEKVGIKKIGELLHDAEGMAGQNRLPMQAYPAGIYFVRMESQVVGVVKR